MIEPAHWLDHAIILPLSLILLFFTFAIFTTAADASKNTTVATLVLLSILAGGVLLGGVTAFQLSAAALQPSGVRLADRLLQLRARGKDVPSGLAAPVIDARRGLLLAAAGSCLIAAQFVLPVVFDISDVAARLGNINQFITWFAFGLLVRARSYFQTNADALLAADHRSPILLLRSFEDDEKAQFGQGERQLLDFSLETRLANHFMRFGPFIAIGSPLDRVPQIGAARAKLSDDQWQSVVLGWMNAASVVVMLAGKTKWVTWELGKLVDRQYLPKVVLLLPSKGFRRKRRRADTLARLEHVQNALSHTQWANALAAIERVETVRAITFHIDGTLTLIRSKSRSRDAYHLSALIAHYLLLPAASHEQSAAMPRAHSWGRRLIAGGVVIAILALAPLFASGWLSSLCAKRDAFCALAGLPVPSKIIRATQAAEQLVAIANERGAPPRISEPEIAGLLSRAFDSSILENVSDRSWATFMELAHWFDAVQAAYSIYLLSGTGFSDLAAALSTIDQQPDLEKKLAANVEVYQEELGSGLDAQMRLVGKSIEAFQATIDPSSKAATENEKLRTALVSLRGTIYLNVLIDLWAIYVPATPDEWRQKRLVALASSAPIAARFVTPEQRQFLANLARTAAQAVSNADVKRGLTNLAAVFNSA